MNFKKGDYVIINPKSKYSHQGYKNNIQLIGTIIEYPTKYDDLGYMVDWGGGQTGMLYNDEDLIPYNSEPNYEIY